MELSLLDAKKLYTKRIEDILSSVQNGFDVQLEQRCFKVLHIDDDSSTLQVSKMFLEEIDPSFRLVCESDPACVIDYLQDNVDCFIVDYSMPSMNGVELSKQIRRFTDKPIVLFTSKDCSEVPLKEMSEMDIDYVQKKGHPCVYYLLSKTIRRLVYQNNLTKLLVSSLETVVQTQM